MTEEIYMATGRRKTSIARVRIVPGSGSITVNGKSVEEYFGRKTLQMIINQPFVLTNNSGRFDVSVNVDGGGLSGQAGAVKHGITLSLLRFNPELRAVLKKAGFITRDSRAKERKKYGQRAARARFQFSKR